ncbi:hypothetical protein RMA95_10190 [Acinetobacter sp. V110_1]|uniref:hypothetical protein n=1 Tax=Acinetobacter sp. V110_1 TaxID=3072988 RepID=UPI00287E8F66|nr:hypothetical protein [Acinetobacter sp. V110_1]MDS7944273.1 hypothetical protein [Acinetobacter sp. V110_1]
MTKIFFTLFLSLIFCNSVFANSPFPQTKVGKLVVHDSGSYVIVVLKSPVATGEGCASSNEIKLNANHPLFKIMYATLLSALHGQTLIEGWVNGCDGREPILTRLDISK